MVNEIKVRLVQLGKKQRDLLPELKKRGFGDLAESQLSLAVNFKDKFPQTIKIQSAIREILSNWEKETEE